MVSPSFGLAGSQPHGSVSQTLCASTVGEGKAAVWAWRSCGGMLKLVEPHSGPPKVSHQLHVCLMNAALEALHNGQKDSPLANTLAAALFLGSSTRTSCKEALESPGVEILKT